MKKSEFHFAIAYADTDAGGIVYHGRYVEIAERARMQLLRGLKIPDGDVGFVVRELKIKYLSPLKLADEFVVISEIIKMGAASMTIEQKFVKDDTICAILDISIAYIGGNLRPRAIPDYIAQRFRD